MGREASISYEDVVNAATAITSEGGKLTLRAIRERLGRGSLGTVQDHFRRWRAGQSQGTLVSQLPAALEQALLEFAGEEVARARAALQAELDAAQQFGDELAQENARLTEALEQQGEQLEAARVSSANLRGQVEQLQSQLDAAKREAHAAVATERERADVARQAQSDAETRAAVATEKAAGLNARLGDFDTRLREEIQRHGDIVAKLEADKKQLEAELRACGMAVSGRPNHPN